MKLLLCGRVGDDKTEDCFLQCEQLIPVPVCLRRSAVVEHLEKDNLAGGVFPIVVMDLHSLPHDCFLQRHSIQHCNLFVRASCLLHLPMSRFVNRIAS